MDARFRCQTNDGQYRWMRVRAKAHRENGADLRWFGLAEDIHDQVLADEALRASDEHYRNSFELSAHVQWIASQSGSVEAIGPRWSELMELDAEHAHGDGWVEALHPDDVSRALNTWQEALSTGAPYHAQFRLQLRSGEYRWFHARASALYNQQGEIVRWYGSLEDIHEQVLAERALRQSEERFRSTIELSPHMPWCAGPDAALVEMSPKWLDLVGMSETEALGQGWTAAIHPDDFSATMEAISAAIATGRPFDNLARVRMRDGSFRWQRAQAASQRNEGGQIVRWYGLTTDVHELVIAQQALQESEERFRLAARAAGLGVFDYDVAANTLTWSDELRNILGVSPDRPAALWLASSHVHPDDRWQIEQFLAEAYSTDHDFRFEATLRIRRSGDDAIRWVTTNGWKTMQAGRLNRVIITVRDVTEEKTVEERINWIATHDALTRLPNRALFQEELIQAIEHANAATGSVGLLLVDVDHFKQINDTLGHDAGDALLQAFAIRLRACLRADDVVARFGGDEFAIALPAVAGEESLLKAIGSITERLEEPLYHAGQIVECGARIGASLYPQHATNPVDLLKNADIALYAAKAAGGGPAVVFRSDLRADIQRRTSMLSLARTALEEDRITPFYQPKVDMASGELVGFEALLRWSHPRLGVQLPDTIAAAFEDLDLANAISDRMFERVAGDMRRWLDAGLDFGHVAVNASAAEFRHDDLAERILDRFEAAGVPTRILEVEVTETVFLGRGSEYIERALRKLSDAGVRIALDDFGTGFASLTHLKQFPVDIIKIDRSFVSNIELDRNDAVIVNAVLNLSQSLGIRVVAEGVENAFQAEYLRKHGCDYGQGWFYAEALPAGDMQDLIRNWRHSSARKI